MGEADAAFREGGSHFAAGRFAEAVAAYRRTVSLGTQDPSVYFNLGAALLRCGDLAESALAFRRAERLVPGHPKVLATLFEIVAEWVRRGGGSDFAPPAPEANRDEPLSIVVCSIDDAKLTAVRENFTRALGGRAHEVIAIRDARSLAEAYNRGLAKARFDTVAFSHDDVELVSPRPFDHLCAALAQCDVVGVVGTRLVNGPAVQWAGHPHLHGWMAHPALDREGWRPWVYSLEVGLLPQMQALDGLLFVARREAARRVAFDENTFDGFHFYDLDFTYRAHRAGLRVAVTTDVLAIHQSRGHFGDAWERAAARFRAKYPELDGARGQNHAYTEWVPDRSALLRFFGTLRQLAIAR